MIEKLDVHLQHFDLKILCGQLILNEDQVYFKYAKGFLDQGFNISPLKMSFNQEIQSVNLAYFNRLFGVFHDSLPDGWGHLLMQRYFNEHNIPTAERNVLLQLSYLSDTSKGALVYRPSAVISNKKIEKSLEDLEVEIMQLYLQEKNINVDEIFMLGASSGGARPKVDAWIHKSTGEIRFNVTNDENFELHLIKFRSDTDYIDIAQIEYCYMLMAEQAGIEVPSSKVIYGESNRAYFATKRFDRDSKDRIHAISAAGLLHDNFRNSNIDYGHIMDAAFQLDRKFESYNKILRLAIFNILAHNKDDHSKNFSFMADRDGKYTLAPAYDLTFSYGINTYRSTALAGEQRIPRFKHVKQLADHFGVKKIDFIVDEVNEAVKRWPILAAENGVTNISLNEIEKNLKQTANQFFS